MANENRKPTAAEKGKGKATDDKLPDGDGKTDGGKAGQDGKLTNGKKGDEPHEGIILGRSYVRPMLMTDGSVEELSEEDQNLKNELEMLVSRLQVDS